MTELELARAEIKILRKYSNAFNRCLKTSLFSFKQANNTFIDFMQQRDHEIRELKKQKRLDDKQFEENKMLYVQFAKRLVQEIMKDYEHNSGCKYNHNISTITRSNNAQNSLYKGEILKFINSLIEWGYLKETSRTNVYHILKPLPTSRLFPTQIAFHNR